MYVKMSDRQGIKNGDVYTDTFLPNMYLCSLIANESLIYNTFYNHPSRQGTPPCKQRDGKGTKEQG